MMLLMPVADPQRLQRHCKELHTNSELSSVGAVQAIDAVGAQHAALLYPALQPASLQQRLLVR
jgi:hypothetical protein